jgi:hypothetical protein
MPPEGSAQPVAVASNGATEALATSDVQMRVAEQSTAPATFDLENLQQRHRLLESRINALETKLRQQQLQHLQSYLHSELDRYKIVKAQAVASSDAAKSRRDSKQSAESPKAESIAPAAADVATTVAVQTGAQEPAGLPQQAAPLLSSAAASPTQSQGAGAGAPQPAEPEPAAAKPALAPGQLRVGADLSEFGLLGRARRVAETLLGSANELERAVDCEATDDSANESLDELDPSTTIGRKLYVLSSQIPRLCTVPCC